MDVDKYVIGSIATLAWQDGLTSGLNGMIGVASVVRNRIDSGWHDGDWVATIWQLMTKRERFWGEPPDPRDPTFKTLLDSCESFYNGGTKDPVNGATYYLDMKTEFLSPGSGDTLHGVERVAKIGFLEFLKKEAPAPTL